VPYFDALYYLRHAQALIAIGSNDPSYSASKIFPCLLARRPLLLIFHEQSLVLKLAEQLSAGVRFAFSKSPDLAAIAGRVHAEWFAARGYDRPAALDESAFAPHTAAAMTAALAEVFNAAVTAPR
jgi:hypothetical protein